MPEVRHLRHRALQERRSGPHNEEARVSIDVKGLSTALIENAGLDPGNVVEELEPELLHSEADAVNDVGGAGDPHGAVGL